MDWNLRDLLDLAAGEPPRRVSLEAVRRRAIRRRVSQTGFAGLAVVVATAAAVTLSAGATGAGQHPAANTHPQAGPPRYYVVETGPQQPIAVRATATGRVTGTVPQPREMTCGGQEDSFAATANETFFMLCTAWRHGSGAATSPDTFVYRFKVTSTGRVTGFSPVRGGELKGMLGDEIAVTPDGTQVAVEATKPPPTGPFYTNTAPAGIFVINTRTGQRALWRNGPYLPGAVQFAYAQDISFSGSGRELVVAQSRCRRTRYLVECNGHAQVQVRAYRQPSGGGSLERGQVLAQNRSISAAVISQDSSALTEELIACPRRGTCTLSVERVSLRTHRAVVLYLTRTGTPSGGVFSRFFSADPTGRYLIVDAGAGNARVNGWIDHGKLVPLAPSDGNAPAYEAW